MTDRTNTATSPSPPDQLRHLAQQVRQLAPDRRQPEVFREEKSEVEAALKRISAEPDNAVTSALVFEGATVRI